MSRGGSVAAKRRLGADLVGEQSGWLAACRQAVQADRPDWLLRFVRDSDDVWPLPLLKAAGADELGIQGHEEFVATARVIAAQALIAFHFRQLQRDETTDDASTRLHEAINVWLALSAVPARGPHPRDGADEIHAVIRSCDAPHTRVIAFTEWLWSCYGLATTAPLRDLMLWVLNIEDTAWDLSIRVPVLLDDNLGLVAVLHLQKRSSRRGDFYPNPRFTSFLTADTEFRAAFETAWHYATHGREAADVRWRLTQWAPRGLSGVPLHGVEGPSIGLSVAVGLAHLFDPELTEHDRNWAFSGKWALTGRLEASGDVLSVAGYRWKLQAARDVNLNVIVPQADIDEARTFWPRDEQELIGVRHVEEALVVAGDEREWQRVVDAVLASFVVPLRLPVPALPEFRLLLRPRSTGKGCLQPKTTGT